MAKGNIRSMRFSDQIIELIESQVGDTFTAKFEALVTKCCWELPMKEQQLAEIQKQIDNQNEKLKNLTSKIYQMEANLFRTGNIIGNYTTTMKQKIHELKNL